jgi:hypothetical protein
MSTTEEAKLVYPVPSDSLTTGFVRVEEDRRTLILPDYSGNLFYQTLGSIESDRMFPDILSDDRSRRSRLSKLHNR